MQQDQHALLGADPELLPQSIAASIDVAQHFVVGDPLVAEFNGDACATAFGDVAIDEVRRNVERVGDAERGSARAHDEPPAAA